MLLILALKSKHIGVKMNKKLSLVIICMFAVVTLFSGCSLVTVNQGKYLNQVVATVGETEITKEELITTYNNNYESLSEDYSQNEMVDYCLNLLIDRAILEQHSKARYTLTQNDKNDILINTYDAIVKQLGEYEGEVRAEWNITSSSSAEESEDTAKATYKPYESKADFVNGEIVIKDTTEAVENAHYGFADKVAGFKTYWVYEREDVATEAYSRYIDSLRDYEELKGIETEKDDDVLLHEIDRIYTLYEKQQYLTVLQAKYNEDLIKTITTDMVLSEYQRLINENRGRYDLVEVGMDAYVDDMLNKADKVYYHPVNGEFFYVSHVLLQFSEEQQAQVDEMKKLLEDNAILQSDYDAFLASVAQDIQVQVIDENGNATGTTLSVDEAYNNISASVNNGSTLREKAQNFNEFIYSYNSDPGIQNAEKDYVIGKAIEEDTESRSKMVEAFTQSSRDLYDQYLIDGILGNISGLVLTDYGYHIIMLTGVANNMIVSTNSVEACEDLNSYYVNAHTDKTYFHVIFDSLITNDKNYETYTNGVLVDYKSNNEIVKYTSRYSDMKA